MNLKNLKKQLIEGGGYNAYHAFLAEHKHLTMEVKKDK